MTELHDCRDCGVKPGALHIPGCHNERCPTCGTQTISCDCVYEINGMDTFELEEKYPEIYKNGPTAEMYAKWDATWAARRIPWSGEYPGTADCRELGFWCVGPPWESVPAGTPGAREDLNRLYSGGARWDPDRQKWVSHTR